MRRGLSRLKITVSAGQGRPWAPRKALQQRNLEATGGWALGRRHDLGPHRGLTGRVAGDARGRPGTERQPAVDGSGDGRLAGCAFLVVRGAGRG